MELAAGSPGALLEQRRQWLALNQVICEVCEPHVSRRTIRKVRRQALAGEKAAAKKADASDGAEAATTGS